jgi:hypothetical protein
VSIVAAWLATYLGHSTLLLGAALLAHRRLRSAALRELVLRIAFVGAIVSSAGSTVVQGALRPAAGGPRLVELRVERETLPIPAAVAMPAGSTRTRSQSLPRLPAPPSTSSDALGRHPGAPAALLV